MLSPLQIETLKAVVDRIIPIDDFPGGWDSGVGKYILTQLHSDLAGVVEIYRLGLDALEDEARVVEGNGFSLLDASAQDALLTRIENGTVTAAWHTDPVAFFNMMIDHSMEGFYSDPGNGGNTNGIAWKMIGFEVRG